MKTDTHTKPIYFQQDLPRKGPTCMKVAIRKMHIFMKSDLQKTFCMKIDIYKISVHIETDLHRRHIHRNTDLQKIFYMKK